MKGFIGIDNIANVIVENVISGNDENGEYILNDKDWSREFVERYMVKENDEEESV